ncbi:hypothetical protein [Pseudomonas sp. Marseille-P9655]|uniref:hypothetical protein n=1 Tax=Pseudomonas sp. Marseille-P9655 TaxID=2866591 RepID=UPI001CE3E7CE|nr:hypothetical protein [Pseudomonas sp. Marseille-P9655]
MSNDNRLPPCDAEVFERGESVGLYDSFEKEDVERLCKELSAVTGWRIDWSYFAGRPHIRALAPAEQHQVKPVALPAPTTDTESCSSLMKRIGLYGSVNVWHGGRIWNACLEEIAKLGPLYSRPVQGEQFPHGSPANKAVFMALESYSGTTTFEQACIQLSEESKALRAQLAERDALLRDVSKKNDLACDRAYRNGLKKGFGYGINGDEDRYNSVMEAYHRSIAQALAEDDLSASAEPSAPKCKSCGDTGTIDDTSKDELPDGLYVERGLVACTACEGLDEPTDLATWKRRAIEAESKLRTYDPHVVELGERAMQALLAEPTPKELVLTKCKLCDQLQADLTERDEEVDRLRAAIAKARKTICLPKSIESLLDSAMEQRP